MNNENFDLSDFWIQPSWNLERHRGVSEDELSVREKELGVVFPELFRRLMKLQNGGDVRRRSLYRNNKLWQLFINGSSIDRLDKIHSIYSFLYNFMSDEEIQAKKAKFDHCFLERLLVFSGMDGHSIACFDYGWLQRDRLADHGYG